MEKNSKKLFYIMLNPVKSFFKQTPLTDSHISQLS